MWVLLAIIMMVVTLKAISFSFTLALIPFALGCLCFGKSDGRSLDNFMAYSFMFILIGFLILIITKLF